MENSQYDPVRSILEELKSDPIRFQKRGGYGRLAELLRDGCSPIAVIELLRGDTTFAGDLLWTVCELDDPAPYVAAAADHLDASDPGTAAYATEVLLRSAQDGEHLRAALHRLKSAPLPIREHAILVLATQGLTRAREVFDVGNWGWAAVLVDGLFDGSQDAEATLVSLISDVRQDRVSVGLVIATIASEQDERAVRILEQSESEWVRNFAGQLRRMFERRWMRAE